MRWAATYQEERRRLVRMRPFKGGKSRRAPWVAFFPASRCETKDQDGIGQRGVRSRAQSARCVSVSGKPSIK